MLKTSIIRLIVLSFLCSVTFSSVSSSATPVWKFGLKVESTISDQAGLVRVMFFKDGAAFEPCEAGNHWFSFSATAPGGSSMQNVVIAAFSTGKPASALINCSTSQISAIKVEAETAALSEGWDTEEWNKSVKIVGSLSHSQGFATFKQGIHENCIHQHVYFDISTEMGKSMLGFLTTGFVAKTSVRIGYTVPSELGQCKLVLVSLHE